MTGLSRNALFANAAVLFMGSAAFAFQAEIPQAEVSAAPIADSTMDGICRTYLQYFSSGTAAETLYFWENEALLRCYRRLEDPKALELALTSGSAGLNPGAAAGVRLYRERWTDISNQLNAWQTAHESAPIQRARISVENWMKEQAPKNGGFCVDGGFTADANGLALSAISRVSGVLEDASWIQSCDAWAETLNKRLYSHKNGKLSRAKCGGEKAGDGTLGDYGFLVQGLLDLYEASFNPRILAWAVQLNDVQNQFFFDEKSGRYTLPESSEMDDLLLGTILRNQLRIAQFTAREDLRVRVARALAPFMDDLVKFPRKAPRLVTVLDSYLSEPQQIVIAGDDSSDTREMLRQVRSRYLPNSVLILLEGGKRHKELSRVVPFVGEMKRVEDRPTAYVCVKHACQLPATSAETLGRMLDGDYPAFQSFP